VERQRRERACRVCARKKNSTDSAHSHMHISTSLLIPTHRYLHIYKYPCLRGGARYILRQRIPIFRQKSPIFRDLSRTSGVGRPGASSSIAASCRKTRRTCRKLYLHRKLLFTNQHRCVVQQDTQDLQLPATGF
jgi:hypothetical protein